VGGRRHASYLAQVVTASCSSEPGDARCGAGLSLVRLGRDRELLVAFRLSRPMPDAHPPDASRVTKFQPVRRRPAAGSRSWVRDHSGANICSPQHVLVFEGGFWRRSPEWSGAVLLIRAGMGQGDARPARRSGRWRKGRRAGGTWTTPVERPPAPRGASARRKGGFGELCPTRLPAVTAIKHSLRRWGGEGRARGDLLAGEHPPYTRVPPPPQRVRTACTAPLPGASVLKRWVWCGHPLSHVLRHSAVLRR
jgi:hypothetical protein